MYLAILDQVQSPPGYTVAMLRRQIANWLLKYPHRMAPYWEPIRSDYVSYEHWVRGIDSGRCWGDETVLIALTMMWNVSVTVVRADAVTPIQHREENPDIMLLGNGRISENNNTHFVSTR